jgi:hypothetical protein
VDPLRDARCWLRRACWSLSLVVVLTACGAPPSREDTVAASSPPSAPPVVPAPPAAPMPPSLTPRERLLALLPASASADIPASVLDAVVEVLARDDDVDLAAARAMADRALSLARDAGLARGLRETLAGLLLEDLPSWRLPRSPFDESHVLAEVSCGASSAGVPELERLEQAGLIGLSPTAMTRDWAPVLHARCVADASLSAEWRAYCVARAYEARRRAVGLPITMSPELTEAACGSTSRPVGPHSSVVGAEIGFYSEAERHDLYDAAAAELRGRGLAAPSPDELAQADALVRAGRLRADGPICSAPVTRGNAIWAVAGAESGVVTVSVQSATLFVLHSTGGLAAPITNLFDRTTWPAALQSLKPVQAVTPGAPWLRARARHNGELVCGAGVSVHVMGTTSTTTTAVLQTLCAAVDSCPSSAPREYRLHLAQGHVVEVFDRTSGAPAADCVARAWTAMNLSVSVPRLLAEVRPPHNEVPPPPALEVVNLARPPGAYAAFPRETLRDALEPCAHTVPPAATDCGDACLPDDEWWFVEGHLDASGRVDSARVSRGAQPGVLRSRAIHRDASAETQSCVERVVAARAPTVALECPDAPFDFVLLARITRRD